MVSVIIPAYNCKRFLQDAVESVLAQTYSDYEIVIIDDASADGTSELARELKDSCKAVRVLTNSDNIGVAKTRNRGIECAGGEIIAFLDADDMWLPHKLERQIELMEEKQLDLCYTSYDFIDEQGNRTNKPYRVPKAVCWKKMLRENMIGLSTVTVRRSAIGDTRMRGEYAHEDYVFWLELMQKGCKLGGIEDTEVLYRRWESNRSGNKKQAAWDRWLVYRDFLALSKIRSCAAFASYAVNGMIKHYF
jgi:teichuronic acid biosynthesis glycosyltransferase TuaG